MPHFLIFSILIQSVESFLKNLAIKNLGKKSKKMTFVIFFEEKFPIFQYYVKRFFQIHFFLDLTNSWNAVFGLLNFTSQKVL